MRSFLAALAWTAMTIAPASAQQTQQGLEESMAAAQAQAARPGDEALTCEQLQTEIFATMNDPRVQANIAANGQQAMAMQEQARNAQRQGMGMTGMGIVGGIVGSFIPGFGFAQQAMMMGQYANMQRQAEQNRGQMNEMMGNMEEIMPQLMRGQRLYELAQARQCAFLQGPPPGAPPEQMQQAAPEQAAPVETAPQR